MANKPSMEVSRRTRPRRARLTSMSERQLAAYLEARDVLRRLKEAAATWQAHGGVPDAGRATPSA